MKQIVVFGRCGLRNELKQNYAPFVTAETIVRLKLQRGQSTRQR